MRFSNLVIVQLMGSKSHSMAQNLGLVKEKVNKSSLCQAPLNYFTNHTKLAQINQRAFYFA